MQDLSPHALLWGMLRECVPDRCAHDMQAYSSWQVLLVDLRCHGESVLMEQRRRTDVMVPTQQQPLLPQRQGNSLESAASDVLGLLSYLKLFPEVLIGHSFGGKVVMSMADQFGRIGPRLPRPVQVHVLP